MPNLTRRLFLLVGLGAVPTLAACTFPGQRPAPPPHTTPTPRPTPTVTLTPASIALPNRPPSPTAGPRRTPVRTPLPELTGAGELLYVSAAPETPGVVLRDADGARQRIIVPGDYGRAVWSPDGGRIAVTNPYNSPAVRVELYDPTGRVLQRVALEGRILEGPSWARAGGTVLVSVMVPPDSSPNGRGVRYWLISEGEGRSSGQDGVVELDLGGSLDPWEWSVNGRLAVTVIRGQPPRIAEAELWTVDANGADARRLAVGYFAPAGWSPDGLTLYGVGDYRPAVLMGENQYTALTGLFTISERDGLIRRGTGLAEIAAQLAGAGATLPRPLQAIRAAAPAPTGGQIALWCALEPAPTGSQGTPMAFVVVIVDTGGRLLWWEGVAAPASIFILPGWSPIGTRLAYAYGDKSGSAALRVVTPATGDAFMVELSGLDVPQWSPAGRWLAANTRRGLEIIDTDPPGRPYPLATGGRSPSWNPKGR